VAGIAALAGAGLLGRRLWLAWTELGRQSAQRADLWNLQYQTAADQAAIQTAAGDAWIAHVLPPRRPRPAAPPPAEPVIDGATSQARAVARLVVADLEKARGPVPARETTGHLPATPLPAPPRVAYLDTDLPRLLAVAYASGPAKAWRCSAGDVRAFYRDSDPDHPYWTRAVYEAARDTLVEAGVLALGVSGAPCRLSDAFAAAIARADTDERHDLAMAWLARDRVSPTPAPAPPDRPKSA
jgi:hypothetical protein